MYLKSSEVKPGNYLLNNDFCNWKPVEVLSRPYYTGLLFKLDEWELPISATPGEVPTDTVGWQWKKIESLGHKED